MKALTVRQPWASAIFWGKDIENRSQLWGYRGQIAIHAAATDSQAGWDSPLVRDAFGGRVDIEGRTVPRSAILGTVELVDCHPDGPGCCRPWGESSYVEHGGRVRSNVTHLVFENAVLLDEPIPCRGALGLWTLPTDIVAHLSGIQARGQV